MKARSSSIADMLVAHVTTAQATGATTAEIAEGFRQAADRVAAWQRHHNWPRLRDGGQ